MMNHIECYFLFLITDRGTTVSWEMFFDFVSSFCADYHFFLLWKNTEPEM